MKIKQFGARAIIGGGEREQACARGEAKLCIGMRDVEAVGL